MTETGASEPVRNRLTGSPPVRRAHARHRRVFWPPLARAIQTRIGVDVPWHPQVSSSCSLTAPHPAHSQAATTSSGSSPLRRSSSSSSTPTPSGVTEQESQSAAPPSGLHAQAAGAGHRRRACRSRTRPRIAGNWRAPPSPLRGPRRRTPGTTCGD